MIRFLAKGAPLAALVLCAACSDSSGPPGPGAAVIAQHLDSLYTQGCGVFHNVTRCEVLYFALHAAALGATPSYVTVRTSSGPQLWQGYVVLSGSYIYGNQVEGPWDSTYTMVLYRDRQVTTALLVFPYALLGVQPPVSGMTAQLVQDTIATEQTRGSGGITTTHLGNTCGSMPSFPEGTSWFGVCRLGTFNASMNVTFTLPPGIDPEFGTITIDPQSLHGARDVPKGVANTVVEEPHGLR
jgi:hypothetical protein